MAYQHSGGGNSEFEGPISCEYSGDEHDPRSGEDRLESGILIDKPIYLLEHLATFTVNKESGIIYPADGMRRLLQLEKTTGIWSQKMQLCLDFQWVLIMDYETGNIIERFPASLIQDPTAFTSTDAMELYNNILVFVVSGGSGSRSEMHIFQCQSVSAVHLVEDLKNLRNGKTVSQQREISFVQQQQYSAQKSNSSIMNRSEDQQHLPLQYSNNQRLSNIENYKTNSVGISSANAETDSEHGAGGLNDETSSNCSDKYEKDVTVLNHCFDDIEKFIARLQHAAAATRELERRRRNRKTKKKDPGEGLLTLRTRPPHEKEFIDIFAKFKLSFNLLAKLKAHIHDPNAPELVHFLFTPLALIVEASSDTYYESQLPARVINPLLTREAINLLVNCVTSKETELWRSLGDAWVIPRDQWKDDIGSYHPVFMDGWSPDFLIIDELEQKSMTSVNSTRKRHLDAHRNNTSNTAVQSINYDDFDGNRAGLNEKYLNYQGHYFANTDRPDRTDRGLLSNDLSTRSEISIDSLERIETIQNLSNDGTSQQNAETLNSLTSGMQNLQAHDAKNSEIDTYETNANKSGTKSEMNLVNVNLNDDQLLETWLQDLQAIGAKIVLVTYPRTANNDKELTVVRGEYLEILDDTRKWWKVRNIRRQIAHVPHTIVTPYNYGSGADIEPDNIQFYSQQQQLQQHHHLHQQHQQQQQQQQQQQNTFRSKHDNLEPSSNDTTEWIRNKHLGKKGEFRYF